MNVIRAHSKARRDVVRQHRSARQRAPVTARQGPVAGLSRKQALALFVGLFLAYYYYVLN